MLATIAERRLARVILGDTRAITPVASDAIAAITQWLRHNWLVALALFPWGVIAGAALAWWQS